MKENGEAQMKRRTVVKGLGLAGVLSGLAAESLSASGSEVGAADASGAVYELRLYTAAEGKLPELLKRFGEHTRHLFEQHGMKNVAYWTPMDESGPNPKSKTLIYILKHPSREAAAANWKAFQDDPEWQKVKAKSEENGKLVEKVDSTYMVLTDFSAKIG
jgi:NIPSNAP protein